MSFYTIYLTERLVELYSLEQESIAIAREGRLISTLKSYQSASEAAIALANQKHLPLLDRTQQR